ncbi:hypothetical protein GIB67_039054 [Kingdonia uniflora]|uniref:Uncharacterized protein n=1 Tax=Kingdonia uniflora TaxID=39325 RepID=A0A7J7LKS5_9MAGN|nr:hypothetical protein GIB67_039054 [Kingdonia uniflora]
MGLYTLCLAGGGFMLVGAWESLTSAYNHLNHDETPPSLSPPHHETPTRNTNGYPTKPNLFLSLGFVFIAVLSIGFIFNSLISLIDAHNSKDQVGVALQLVIMSISFVFLLYSVIGALKRFTNWVSIPSSILNLIAIYGFGEEFLLFYLQRKDPNGLENRYFDLLLVPITICFFSTFLKLGSPSSSFPNLARGVGLILQGTWFIQMGFSFFTNWMAHGCDLHESSRGNFTVKCKGHPEYHRSKAIATLQFNCHLAFLVVLIVGLYSFIARKYGVSGDYLSYKPLGAELRLLEHQTQFTLDSDDDEIVIEEVATKQKDDVRSLSAVGFNGFGVH